MAVFNSSNYTNLTKITEMLDVAGTFTNGKLGFGIWLIFSFGIYFLLSAFDLRSRLIAATFASFVLSVILTYTGLLAGQFVMYSLTFFAISIILALVIKGDSGGNV